MNKPIHKKLLLIMFLSIFAGIASYFISYSRAADPMDIYYQQGPDAYYCAIDRCRSIPTAVLRWPQYIEDAQKKGDVFEHKVGIKKYSNLREDISPFKTIIQVSSKYNSFEFLGYRCENITCYLSSAKELNDYRHRNDVMVCVDTPANGLPPTGNLIVSYRLKRDVPRENLVTSLDLMFRGGTAWGTCSEDPDPLEVWWYSILSCSISHGINTPCDRGPQSLPAPDPGESQNKNVSHSISSGTNLNSNSDNGSSEGTVANQLTDSQNPIPAPSLQGESQAKSEIQPSPFYDGKEYDRGSDATNIATINIANRRISFGLLHVAGIILLIIGSGFVVWWWKRR